MSEYIGKIVYRGEGASVSFDCNVSFAELCTRIQSRFPLLIVDSFQLKFTVPPDSTIYLLEKEVDMKMLFIVLDLCKSVFVDIKVLDRSEPARVNLDIVRREGTNMSQESSLVEPNEYLGCFRRCDPKIYMSNSWRNNIECNGQIFEGGVKEFRMKLRMYSIEVGFEYVFSTNKAHRVVAICSKKETEGCEWCVKASLVRHNNFFCIYSLHSEHQCRTVVRVRDSKMVNSDMVKEVIIDKVRDNPNSKAVDIQKDLKLNFGLDIPYHKAWKGKELARELVLGIEAESYRELNWFRRRTLEVNPGTYIDVECSPVSQLETDKVRFKRMFVSYYASCNGFQYCRPVLHIDATFITNKYRGMLLAATAKDANSGMYPVSYAIVDSETEDNWEYFFNHLRRCLSRFPEREISFISDRNIGLLKSVRHIFPNSPLGFCYRHLKNNLTNKFPAGSAYGKTLTSLFMRCAYSRTRDYFEANMKEFRRVGGTVVENFLKDLPYENWALCFFNGERFGEMTNNLAECFNSWIKDLKGLPIVELNEALRVKMMSLIANRKDIAAGWVDELCPTMEKLLAENAELGRHWELHKSDTFVYEVFGPLHSVTVDLESLTCSCGEWQCYGFPCAHAVIAVQKHGADIYSYVNPMFKVDKYRSTYGFPIRPVPSICKELDMRTMEVNVEPPLTKRPAGRPKVNRYKSKNEFKRVLKCGRCNKTAGHNRKTCKEII